MLASRSGLDFGTPTTACFCVPDAFPHGFVITRGRRAALEEFLAGVPGVPRHDDITAIAMIT
jgi:hypothetical protein